MTPALLFILIFTVADVTLSAPVDDYENDESVGDSEIVPRPKADLKTAMLQGDIAVPNTLSRNADECTDRGCKWPKSGRYVYVPYFISETFSQEERDIIIRGLQGFNQSTCIRLIPWKPGHRDHIYIESKDGCWSYVGRQNGGQYLSLQKPGCVYNEVVQHEILHALGFNHEQVRSDRDNYVRILFDNIEPNYKFAFEKKQTNNLGTPYDFTSVMEYRNDAFSKNGKPTIVARCNPNLKFGNSKKMSANDIIRINKLYECRLPGLKRLASRPKHPKNEQLPF
ncbi:high choriolytic enzyme 1-like isoform X2 [Poecilia latipinna]|uniref:high choriolytic enzyme 1-like isoform X2 n=1 Tax=Poecilia formosa TaxID=48698 RepID=UPI000443CE5C|nr:PREDICTED: high choriolytic enzyme 1-like isoform X2 [Poecilia formosa]XP_014867164.1 PREDICTED: high choriolytic enzyme 1-like isoform X2 [Poecilia mexicana]XP_014879734.1 PREDICTED: high choriolytic enzyme 1-like isoform X2 [Poecilia latipinna]